MDSSRKASREVNETTLQYKSRQETLLDRETCRGQTNAIAGVY